MIKDMTDGYLDEVLASTPAQSIEGNSALDRYLEYLGSYADHDHDGATRCLLFKDFAPLSFFFRMEKRDKDGEYRPWFVGGLIFHGQHDNGGDGGAPTYSVNLSPCDGWSVHT
jgi:hypothetical protein